MLFFTSDLHFGHTNIVEKYNRGGGRFNSINHHDQVLIQNWWNTVGEGDTVYLLGDIALGRVEETVQAYSTLPGRKLLVPGNHDYVFSGVSAPKRKRYISVYEDAGLTILPETTEVELTTPNGAQTVLLSHFPYDETDLPVDKWKAHRPDKSRKLPLLCGHTHSTSRFGRNRLEFNVGVDANGFTPVSEATIVAWLETLPRRK